MRTSTMLAAAALTAVAGLQSFAPPVTAATPVTTKLDVPIPARWKIAKPSQVGLRPLTAGTQCTASSWVPATNGHRYVAVTVSCTHPATAGVRRLRVFSKRRPSRRTVVAWTWAAPPSTSPTPPPGGDPTGGPGAAAQYTLNTDATAPAGFVTWNHCAPVNVAVNPNGYPKAEVARVVEAINRVAQASGIPFRYAGPSTFTPTTAAGWTSEAGIQVVVALADSRNDLLAGHSSVPVGLAAPLWSVNPRWAVGGSVVIDTPKLIQYGGDFALAVYMHELGHIAGLGHSSDRSQIMYSSTQVRISNPTWGAGDAAGLARLGSVPCPS